MATLSIDLDPDDLEWAQQQAAARDTSVSAVVSQCVREARQFQARTEYLDWAFADEPITDTEMEQVARELAAMKL